eukprot:m.264231 g.264231  ORF g.264231 m.264231 type:complete len:281 (+) comp40468_c0_seq4:1113-1955(+)
MLAVLCGGMLRHSWVPKQFNVSIGVPIVKDPRKDISDVNNYRGIAISSVVSKVLENILAERLGRHVQTVEQQFGFKKGHGCADCSFVVKEVIDHYLANGNKRVYCATLDLSKAYDRVSVYQLFQKLLVRECPVSDVKLLAEWYSSLEFRVRWQGKLSEGVSVKNGVRQRGVLSPLLFNVFIDDLLEDLSKSGFGARIAGKFAGSLAYADDIFLLSPTVQGLQGMLDVCSVYAEAHNLKFNVQKSAAIMFSRYSSETTDSVVTLAGWTCFGDRRLFIWMSF